MEESIVLNHLFCFRFLGEAILKALQKNGVIPTLFCQVPGGRIEPHMGDFQPFISQERFRTMKTSARA